jgi:hypothetical protein
MAFQSLDHMIQKMSGGDQWRWDYGVHTGAAAFTAARWYDLSRGHRSGPSNTYPGTNLTWVTCDESTGNGTETFGFPHGGNVSPATKHVINAGGFGNVATAVGFLLLVDMQGYWPGIALNSSLSQTLSGTPSLRYTNGDGCRMYMVSTTAPTTGTPTLSVSYTNQAGTSGRSLGRTVAFTASAIQQHILHSGTAANNIGPFLPLAAGDYGVRNAASVQLSSAMSGTGVAALVIAKPICSIPVTVGSSMVDRDLLTATPGLPLIKDGACLTWLYYSTAATAAGSTFQGYIDFAWA